MESESPIIKTFFFVVLIGSGGPGLHGHLLVTFAAPLFDTQLKTSLYPLPLTETHVVSEGQHEVTPQEVPFAHGQQPLPLTLN
jgi:hypothetical protein